MITRWFRGSPSWAASTRMVMSAKPPAANGITMRTGLLGKFAACAAAARGRTLEIMAVMQAHATRRCIFVTSRISVLPRSSCPPMADIFRSSSAAPRAGIGPEHPGLLGAQLRPESVGLVLMPQNERGLVEPFEQRRASVLGQSEGNLLTIGRRHDAAHQIDGHPRLRRRRHGVCEPPGLRLGQLDRQE